MGRNGRNALAAKTENIFPKLEDAVILIYLIIFPWMPSSRTSKSLFKSTTSALSLAISTAVSTDIPASDTFIAAASLIPSPIYPTTWPFPRSTFTTLAFCSGDSFANTAVFSASPPSCSSVMASKSVPVRICAVSIPTWAHTEQVTLSLSPVRIFTPTPRSRSAFSAAAVVSLGGSRNARYPINTISASSCTEKAPAGAGFVFCATAITRSPLALYSAACRKIPAFLCAVKGRISPR